MMQDPNERQNVTMDDDPYNPHQMNENDDIEVDNRIKELLLSSHNLFLVTQLHEKEIREIGPVIKELPQILGGISRLIGEKGGNAGCAGESGSNRYSFGIGPWSFIGSILGSSVLTAIITAGLIKFLFG